MRIRTRVAQVAAGTAFVGLTALAVGAAAPAGAQQVQPAKATVSSAAPQHPALYQDCDYWGNCDWDWDSWGWNGWGWDW